MYTYTYVYVYFFIYTHVNKYMYIFVHLYFPIESMKYLQAQKYIHTCTTLQKYTCTYP